MTPSSQEAHQLSVVLRSVTEAIITTDSHGSIRLVNTAAEKLFGLPNDQAHGQPLKTLHPALGPWLERAFIQSSPQPFGFQLELRPNHHYAVSLLPVLLDDEGVLDGWVMAVQEVTHLKLTGEYKTEAILAAAHDLRNPINLMNGAVNLLQDTLKDPQGDQLEYIRMIKSGLKRMSRLIDQVLSLDQVKENGGPHFKRVDLNRMLRQATQEFRLTAEEKGLALKYDGPRNGHGLMGDEGWLHRAVSNLLSNAIKYTPEGGEIRVRYREADGQAICEITDTGPGIPSGAQPRLFQRFYRVPGEATRKTSGTGLGLAIVKAVVEQHAGKVWVSSEEGSGSTFGFSLPLNK
jgi:PAS domain S-box-containing protein